MATSEIVRRPYLEREAALPRQISAPAFALSKAMAFLSSLRLTVVLFALSLFLILMGTLAQKDHDVWEVVNDLYFRCWFARIDFLAFERLAQIFFKDVKWDLSAGFYFPGGNLLGLLLLLNLIAAHAVRFKVAASGKRLVIGVATIAAGIVVTWLAIQSGMNKEIESELSRNFCDWLWQFVRGSLAVAAIGGAYLVLFARGRMRATEWRLLLGTEIVVASLAIWLLANPAARLDDAGLRILWQLIKGSAAGIVLLVGCVLVFHKRAGIVLLHGGIGLLMLSELFTGITAKESHMVINIGETVSYSTDARYAELAVIDRSDVVNDHVTVVPGSLLRANVGSGATIDDPQLPFKVQVHRWLQNSNVRSPKPGESNPATTGLGKIAVADEIPAATGVGERSKTNDSPAAYIELISKKNDESLGTYLAAQGIRDQQVTVDGKTYDISLRYVRVHFPYSLTLKNFEFKRYVGTNTPKDYRSTVVLKDPRHNVDREVPIWMNNPLRYDDTTFYQTDFDKEREQYTILSAVNNPSWMTPYVACMLVATGMLTHFGIMLVRFLKRRADESLATVVGNESAYVETNGHSHAEKARKRRHAHSYESTSKWTKPTFWFPALIVLIFAGYVFSHLRMPKSAPSEMQIYEFAKLPLAYQGRIKPYDTLALNTVQILSGRQELKVFGQKGKKTRTSPIAWLLDVISGSDRAKDHQVFRVDNLQLVDVLGLEHRPEYWRYSLRELDTKPGVLQQQIKLAVKEPEETRTLDQKKVLELATKLRLYVEIKYAFEQSPIPSDLNLLLDVMFDASADEKSKLVAALQPPVVPTDPKEIVEILAARGPAASADDKKQLVERLEKSPELIPTLREALTGRFREESEGRAGGLRDGIVRLLRTAEAPCAVPPTDATVNWKPLYEAVDNQPANSQPTPVNPAAVMLRKLLDAYAKGNVAEFNQHLSAYGRLLANYENTIAGKGHELQAARSEILTQPKIDFEVFYNKFSPFYYAAVLYFVAFVLGVWSWIGWSEPLRRASIWLLLFTLVLHTFALVARIYISGRPPITNLYSTAIFIGWGGVIMAMILEAIYRLGLGNIVAALLGFLTLLVAHFLSLDGDTFIVLQAVLDTQFWLATHVVTINLGYAATYTVGLWGAIYVIFAHVFPILAEETRHKLLRMLYGTLCFALYSSFVGTVLGGLWGDDSWGRFWGWDPKENGALMIVIWNALVLHARWGGLVKGRGLAALTVLGNIVTTWSYFGVNELGVGLHAYGAFDSSGAAQLFKSPTAMWIFIFMAIQLAIACLGMMPSRWFEAMKLSRSESVSG